MGDFVTGLTPNWVKVLMVLVILLLALDLLRELLFWMKARER